MKKQELIEAIRSHGLKSVSSVFAVLAGGVEDPASKIPLASLSNTIWPGTYEDERDARFINDRVHGNIQKDGTFSVVPEMAGGICTPAEPMRIAAAAVKYNVPLADGMMGGTTIMCPLHDRMYELRTGAVLVGECDIVTYSARVESGTIFVSI